MKETNVKLFMENYANEGMVADLPKYVKTKEITFKKQNVTKLIKYYHWYIIEMFFSMQGGTHKVLNHVKPITSRYINLVPDIETGEFIEKEQTKTALFCEIELEWKGEKLIELYPIFDSSNSKVITLPDAQDLNNSYKRGLVRGIARISGIGGDRFGDYDDQFGDDGSSGLIPNVDEKEDEDETKEEPKKVEKKKTSSKKVIEPPKEEPKKEEPKKEVVKETKIEEEENDEDLVKNFLDGAAIETTETKVEEKKVEKIKEKKEKIAEAHTQYGEDTEEYADMLLYVKREQKKKGLAKEVKEFIVKKGKELFSELTYEELVELKEELEL